MYFNTSKLHLPSAILFQRPLLKLWLWAYYNTMGLSFNGCTTRQPARSGTGCKGLRHQGLVTVASWRLERGGRCLDGCMKTATTKAPLHRVTAIKTGGVRGKGRNREKQKEGEWKCSGKPGKWQLCVQNQMQRQPYQAKQLPPSRANGLSEVEMSQVLGSALLNINFCQRTWLQLLQEQWQQMQRENKKGPVFASPWKPQT